MRTFLRVLLVVIVLGIFGYTLFYLYSKSQEKDVIYATETPQTRTIIKKTVATGSVTPRREIEVKPRVSGIVDELFVEPGQRVKTGDLLARVKIIPDMVTLNNAENRLNRAKLSFENAEREFKRQKQLFDDGVIAQAALDAAQLALDNAREELNAAESNLQLIQEGVTKNSGNATNTLIRATISGMVLDVPVEVGNSVIESNTFNEGTTIAAIADMGEMVFEGLVDESEVGKIKEGMDLILTIGAIDDQKFDAKLEYIAPKGVEENGAIQFEIRAALKLDENFFIRAGYSANADIVLERVDSVLAIPESLLQFDKEGKPYVEVMTGEQQFEQKTIETGLSDGIFIQVKGGLDKETKIKNPNKEV